MTRQKEKTRISRFFNADISLGISCIGLFRSFSVVSCSSSNTSYGTNCKQSKNIFHVNSAHLCIVRSPKISGQFKKKINSFPSVNVQVLAGFFLRIIHAI